jgi:hypothetical protein
LKLRRRNEHAAQAAEGKAEGEESGDREKRALAAKKKPG